MPRAEVSEIQKKKNKQRGLNLKVIRNLIGSIQPNIRSQKTFAVACGVGVSTLRQWEAGLLYGLSTEGADTVIHFARSHGVICTKEWLFDNVGDSPFIKTSTQIDNKKTTGENLNLIQILGDVTADYVVEKEIEKEVELFVQLNKNAVVQQITDDSMLPIYLSGDYVGGQLLFKEQINSALNRDCIIKLTNGQMLIRHLSKGERAGSYKAYCINIQAVTRHDPLFNISIKAAAPIVRVWRKKIV